MTKHGELYWKASAGRTGRGVKGQSHRRTRASPSVLFWKVFPCPHRLTTYNPQALPDIGHHKHYLSYFPLTSYPTAQVFSREKRVQRLAISPGHRALAWAGAKSQHPLQRGAPLPRGAGLLSSISFHSPWHTSLSENSFVFFSLEKKEKGKENRHSFFSL